VCGRVSPSGAPVTISLSPLGRRAERGGKEGDDDTMATKRVKEMVAAKAAESTMTMGVRSVVSAEVMPGNTTTNPKGQRGSAFDDYIINMHGGNANNDDNSENRRWRRGQWVAAETCAVEQR